MKRIIIVLLFLSILLIPVVSYSGWHLLSSWCVAPSEVEATECFLGGGSGAGFSWTNEGTVTNCEEYGANYETWLEVPAWCSGYVDERNPAWLEQDRYKSIGITSFSSIWWCSSLTCSDFGQNGCGPFVENEIRNHLEECVCPIEGRSCIGSPPSEETGLCCENNEHELCPNPFVPVGSSYEIEHFCEVGDCEAFCQIDCGTSASCNYTTCECDCNYSSFACPECQHWDIQECSCKPTEGCTIGGGGGCSPDDATYELENIFCPLVSIVARNCSGSVLSPGIVNWQFRTCNSECIEFYPIPPYTEDIQQAACCSYGGSLQSEGLSEVNINALGGVAGYYRMTFEIDSGWYHYDFHYPCNMSECGVYDLSCLNSTMNTMSLYFPLNVINKVKDEMYNLRDIEGVPPVITLSLNGIEKEMTLDIGDTSLLRQIEFVSVLIGVVLLVIRKLT